MKKVFAILAAAMLLSWNVSSVAQTNAELNVLDFTQDVGRQFTANIELTGLYNGYQYKIRQYSGYSTPIYDLENIKYQTADNNGRIIASFDVSENVIPGVDIYLRYQVYRTDNNGNEMQLVMDIGDNLSIKHIGTPDLTPVTVTVNTDSSLFHEIPVQVIIVPQSQNILFAWTLCIRNPYTFQYTERYMGLIDGGVMLDTVIPDLEAGEIRDVGVRIHGWNFNYNRTDMVPLQTKAGQAPNVWLEEEMFNGPITILQGGIEYQGSETTTDFRVTEFSSGVEVWTDGPVNRGSYSGLIGEQIFNLTPGEEYLVELFAWNEIDSAVAATTITIPSNLLGVSDGEEVSFNWYPNPAKDHLVIEANEEAELSILDMSGRILWQEPILLGTNRIDLQLPQGTYLIDLVMEHGRKTEKFIVN